VTRLGGDDRQSSAWSAAIRVARSASNSVDPDTDSAVTVSVVPSRSARSSACRVIVATSSASCSSLSQRTSIQAVTAAGTELVEFGVVSSRPKVARCPVIRACLLAASAVMA
jgi:hypothetical protein